MIAIIMDPVYIYGIAAGSIIITCVLYCASSFISNWIQDRTLFYFFKYLVYPLLVRRTRLSSPLSPWHVLLLLIYWSGTVVCNLIGVHTIVAAGNRAGALAALHLIPLLYTDRAAFVSDLIGISLQFYMKMHRSFGLMALVQSLLHVVVFASHTAFTPKDFLQFYGLLVRIFTAGE